MSTFKSTFSKKIVEIRNTDGDIGIYITHPSNGNGGGIEVSPADAPAIALAVLEAGGMANECSGMSKAQEHAWDAANSLRSASRFTAAAAEEAARGKRRDELAAEIGDFDTEYRHCSPALRKAIDRIIDTENELAEERNK